MVHLLCLLSVPPKTAFTLQSLGNSAETLHWKKVRISIYLLLTGKLLYCTAGSCCAFKESLPFADRVKHPALTHPAESIKLQGSLRTVALALRSTECCAWTPLICPGITQIPVQLHLSSPAEARPRADWAADCIPQLPDSAVCFSSEATA